MDMLVASVTCQLKVELSPAVMFVGLAEKELIIGVVGDNPLHPIINTEIAIVKNKLKNLI
jgi:hypothetical protein